MASTTQHEPDTIPGAAGHKVSGNGIAETIVNSAMDWLGSMYDWGGSGQGGRGVDCSGLIYAAYNKAGFPIARYRAVDYGKMGTSVSTQDARPGDIVYFDNPGTTTDHVGIYLGGGKYIDSPEAGKKVRIDTIAARPPTSIRRLLPDKAWNGMPKNSGGIYFRDANAGIMHGNPDQPAATQNTSDFSDITDQGIYDAVDNQITKFKNANTPVAEALNRAGADDEAQRDAENNAKELQKSQQDPQQQQQIDQANADEKARDLQNQQSGIGSMGGIGG